MRLSKLSAVLVCLCLVGPAGCAIKRDNNKLDLVVGGTAMNADGTADAIVHVGFMADERGLTESFIFDPFHAVPYGVQTVRGWVALFKPGEAGE